MKYFQHEYFPIYGTIPILCHRSRSSSFWFWELHICRWYGCLM